MEEKTYQMIKGNELVWHTDPNDHPIRFSNIVVAYTYKNIEGLETISGKLFFDISECYLKENERTFPVAWAYIDDSVPSEILRQIIEKRKLYEIDHAAEIKAKRIAELEAELAELKK